MANDDLVYSIGPDSAEDKRKSGKPSGKTSKEAKGRARSAGRDRKGRAAAPPDPSDGVARVRRESKGRGGKTVTVIHGLALPDDELRELGKELRRLCGSGGSTKNGVIEIQGDHAERMVEELTSRGHRAKRAGG